MRMQYFGIRTTPIRSCGLKWHHFINSRTVGRISGQFDLSSVIQWRCWACLITFLICVMNDADAKEIITSDPSGDWERPYTIFRSVKNSNMSGQVCNPVCHCTGKQKFSDGRILKRLSLSSDTLTISIRLHVRYYFLIAYALLSCCSFVC